MTTTRNTSVPDDRLLDSPYLFSRPSYQHAENCFAHVHRLSENAYRGNGVWATQDKKTLDSLPECSRPLNILDPSFPPLYRNTSWRMIGYANAFRATNNEDYLVLVQAGGDYLIKEQQTNGSFLYYRGQSDGYPNTTHLMFESGFAGAALIEAYRITGEKKYLDASCKISEWLLKGDYFHDIPFDFVDASGRTREWLTNHNVSHNNNYNSIAILFLAEHYKETGDIRYLESAIARTVYGVYPHQLPTGGWPGHNSWIFYHSIILWGFAALYSILPNSHEEKLELRRRILMAVNHMINEQQANGFLRSCSCKTEWGNSRTNAYVVHNVEKICPFAIRALIGVHDWTEIDVKNILNGLLSAPSQNELSQGQEGMMLLAYGMGLKYISDLSHGKI